MDYVNLGNTGLRVSRVCLGMMSYGKDESRPWALDEDAAEPIVRRAVEGGITFFDTADVYNGGASEVVTGRVLQRLFGMREEYVVATKVHGRTMPGENGRGLSRKHILASIDASLQRLELDYVDLYQIHRWDPLTPIEETMEALHDVVKAGKARYIGASSMYAWQFAKAQSVAKTRFVSMQNHYNLVYREEEREMIPQCLDQGVAVLPWSPLARGLLAGNRTREGERLTTRAQTDSWATASTTPELDFAVVDRAAEVAARTWRLERAGRARVAAAQARRDRADRRGDEGRAPRGRARRGAAVAERGRARAARRAVRPARRLRPLTRSPRVPRGGYPSVVLRGAASPWAGRPLGCGACARQACRCRRHRRQGHERSTTMTRKKLPKLVVATALVIAALAATPLAEAGPACRRSAPTRRSARTSSPC